VSGLTVLIPTFNEEANLPACLESVRWADEILVVDANSTDATPDLARRAGARVLQHPYENSAAQKNWAIPQASHEWVLVVDADERVTPELAAEVRSVLDAPGPKTGYWIRRRNFFLGREIRHCGWQRDRVLRLFRREGSRYERKWVHAEVDLPRAGSLEGTLVHHSYRSLADCLLKADRYSTWGARDLYEKGERAGIASMAGHAWFRFFKMFVLQGGLWDGPHGFVVCVMGSFAVFLKYAKLWELGQRGTPDSRS
jgi:glycosyltransferase involved in cell wall biosynthesis